MLLVVLMVALSTAAPRRPSMTRYVVKREAVGDTAASVPQFFPDTGSVDDDDGDDDDISPDSSAMKYPYSFGYIPYHHLYGSKGLE